jgi:hypothetical protein
MEVAQQQQSKEKVKKNQIFESTPPMDPSTPFNNNDNNEHQFCVKQSKNLNTICSPFNSQRFFYFILLKFYK